VLSNLQIIPISGIGEIEFKTDLAKLIVDRFQLKNYDIIIVTQKAVSKAEGRLVKLEGDPNVQKEKLIRANSKRVLRRRGTLFLTETLHGFVCANAGIDFSNIKSGYASLLPRYPDKSASSIRNRIRAITGLNHIAVVISDTFGRPFRKGLCNVAIGVAGLKTVLDYKGQKDTYGNELKVTEIAIADEIAAAAELVMGKTKQIPVAVLRGAEKSWFGNGKAKELIRDYKEDLFR
jgi:coenzyme F420-0:L-glutamate ligase/coenzyme F420-1:gamma-L-glutamate ligase